MAVPARPCSPPDADEDDLSSQRYCQLGEVKAMGLSLDKVPVKEFAIVPVRAVVEERYSHSSRDGSKRTFRISLQHLRVPFGLASKVLSSVDMCAAYADQRFAVINTVVLEAYHVQRVAG